MQRALAEFRVSGPGVHTTAAFLGELLSDPVFRRGEHTTSVVEDVLAARPKAAVALNRKRRQPAGESPASQAA
jgi:pyruvate carboxylase